MIGEVYQAAVEPLTETNTWYGIFLAFSFTKGVKRIVNNMLERVNERVDSDSDEETNEVTTQSEEV